MINNLNQTAQKNKRFPLDTMYCSGVQWQPMAKAKPKPEKIQVRPTDDDYAIIQAAMRKHGVDQCQIIRMALRRLAEADGLKATT